VVWTSLATYVYGPSCTRTNGQLTRRGWEPHILRGPPPSICAHHTLWSCRGRTPYPWFGLLWPHTAMATQVRAQMGSAPGVVGMNLCCGAPAVGLHPPHPVVASCTNTVLVVWTSMATNVYGHTSTRTNGQCTRRGWDAEVSGGPPPSVCTRHTRLSLRGRTSYPLFGLPFNWVAKRRDTLRLTN